MTGRSKLSASQILSQTMCEKYCVICQVEEWDIFLDRNTSDKGENVVFIVIKELLSKKMAKENDR
jgi:hypothetical protein